MTTSLSPRNFWIRNEWYMPHAPVSHVIHGHHYDPFGLDLLDRNKRQRFSMNHAADIASNAIRIPDPMEIPSAIATVDVLHTQVETAVSGGRETRPSRDGSETKPTDAV